MTSLRENAKILIIEDETGLQTVMRRLLRIMLPKVTIEWLTTADEAIQTLATNQTEYDLVLADIYTPGRATGLEVWDYLLHHRPGTPVILMSTMPVSAFLEQSARITPHTPSFLPKPFLVSEFNKVIEHQFRKPRVRIGVPKPFQNDSGKAAA